ncbi:MAG: hypothetical protein H0W24_06775, partial [Lysobacter sp.]|nr:hypothetical protein [Lysobacter sp.]
MGSRKFNRSGLVLAITAALAGASFLPVMAQEPVQDQTRENAAAAGTQDETPTTLSAITVT